MKKHLQLNDPGSSLTSQKAALKSYGLMLGRIDLINVSVAELDVLFQNLGSLNSDFSYMWSSVCTLRSSKNSVCSDLSRVPRRD